MKCPYCHEDMEEGYIPAERGCLFWIPKNVRAPLTSLGAPNFGVKLSKFPFWSIQKAESFYCKTCKIVLTPVSEDLNLVI